jgi:hypothetical protein
VQRACPGYVVDHIMPLCAGGADDPANMMWMSGGRRQEEGRGRDEALSLHGHRAMTKLLELLGASPARLQALLVAALAMLVVILALVIYGSGGAARRSRRAVSATARATRWRWCRRPPRPAARA